VVAPLVGGQDEPQAWYQTNEIARQVAVGIGGTPRFLYAPAFPGARLRAGLVEDPEFGRFTQLWSTARCALTGIGAPPSERESMPGFVTDRDPLEAAVGDVASRFYDTQGAEIGYAGVERLVAIPFDVLARVPVRIAVAYGAVKIPSIVAGARGRHFTHLVTDPATASALLVSLEDT